MKILIIGAGLIGVSTAYFLVRRGYDVTVVERAEGPAQDTSFANGGLLTPSMSDPWNVPGCWRTLLASVGRSNAPMQLHLRALPGLARWGWKFLQCSNVDAFQRNSLRNLQLALYSLKTMHLLREQAQFAYGRNARGTLRIFRDRVSLHRAAGAASRFASEGLKFRSLSTEETVEIEPALAPIARHLAGALYYEADETGDAYRFCVSLADHAREQGVRFRFSTEVTSIVKRSGRVDVVRSAHEEFLADKYIVAAGSHSHSLFQRIGVHVPVQPVKGYSITFDLNRDGPTLKIPVIDDRLHAGVVPMERSIRVVGTAEFAGFNRTIYPRRTRQLLALLGEILPGERFDPLVGRPWCGLRPMSPDGVPIIGQTPLSNLLINTGHGHLGWTMAAGSAALLADFMAGERPFIDPANFSLARFCGG